MSVKLRVLSVNRVGFAARETNFARDVIKLMNSIMSWTAPAERPTKHSRVRA